MTEKPIIDYDRLHAESDDMAKSFGHAQPFSHIVIDDFISPEFTERLNREFPDLAAKRKAGSKHIPVYLDDGSEAQQGKEWLSRERLVPHVYRRL